MARKKPVYARSPKTVQESGLTSISVLAEVVYEPDREVRLLLDEKGAEWLIEELSRVLAERRAREGEEA
jgi:hypothetical protein